MSVNLGWLTNIDVITFGITVNRSFESMRMPCLPAKQWVAHSIILNFVSSSKVSSKKLYKSKLCK